jgi:hypothetical protein
MRLHKLAWGAFLHDDVRSPRDRYGELASDGKFLARLQRQPLLPDFDRLREFIVHYGVHTAPKDLGSQYALVWPRLRPHIRRLAGVRLENCGFSSTTITSAIESAYDCLKWPETWGGDTAASKALHFLNSSLFVMWDEDIQMHYASRFSANTYVDFLRVMQSHALEALKDYEALGTKRNLPKSLPRFLPRKLGYGYVRPLTKVLDDYNWTTTTRHWPDDIPKWLLDLREAF